MDKTPITLFRRKLSTHHASPHPVEPPASLGHLVHVDDAVPGPERQEPVVRAEPHHLYGLVPVRVHPVDLPGGRVERHPLARGHAHHDDVPGGVEAGRLRLVAQVAAPDGAVRQGVPQVDVLVVAGAQELLLLRVGGQRPHLVHVARHDLLRDTTKLGKIRRQI